MDVIGIGFAAVDFAGAVNKYPNWDEKCKLSNMKIEGGGPSANAMVACKRLGLDVGFLGKSSDDYFGNIILSHLKDENIDTTQYVIENGFSSQVAFCFAEEESGHRTIFSYGGTVPKLKIDEIDFDYIKRSKAVHFDGHQMEVSIKIAEFARKNGILTFLDAGSYKQGLENLIVHIDHIFFSKAYAKSISNDLNFSEIISYFNLEKFNSIGITLGEEGSMIFSGNEIERTSAFKVENIVDTTGAGDAFNGGFIKAILDGKNYKESCEFASIVAALKCRELGARSGLPKLTELEKYI